MKRLHLFLITLVLGAGGVVYAADKPLDVRDVMSADQFHQTGLDKLSPEELAAFNVWLTAYGKPAAAPRVAAAPTPASVAPAIPLSVPPAATAGDFGKEMLSSEAGGEPERIETRILGTFTGWTGQTVFKLENGQVWRQSASGIYETRLENPAVVIKKLGVGYLLSLPGHGASVFVRRVQ
jgi:hypothetical protein